jgi:hypothetical protein
MKLNSRDPLSPEAFQSVRARIAEMSGEELMSYLDWIPEIALDMEFPQHPMRLDIHKRAALNSGAEPPPHVSGLHIRKSRHTAKA